MNTYSAAEESPEMPQGDMPEIPDPEGQDLAVKSEEEEDAILATFRYRFNRAKEHTREWRDEARALYDMRAGHQWDPEDAARMHDELRPMVTFNVADKYIDAVNGLQINNRQEVGYYPRELGDAKVNEELTGAVSYCRDNTDALDHETDSFLDLIICGMGWAEGFWDQESNPEGIAAKERRDPLEMYWDPDARHRNLKDKKWVCRIRLFDVDEFEEKFPEAEITASVVSDLAQVVTEFESPDTGITIIDQPQDYDAARTANGSSLWRGKVAVADYQYHEMTTVYHVKWSGGEKRDLTKAQCANVKKMLKDAGMLYIESTQRKRTYWRCFIAGNKIVRRVKLAWQEGFTYFAMTGKRDRNKNVWYGVGRGLRDPQRWVNKFFSQILHVINTNSKGGAFFEEGAFKDQRKAEADWSRPDALVELQKGALANGKIQERKAPVYPDGMDRLLNFSLSMLPQVSGMNPEMMGLADRDQPGVLEAQRKQAAMAIIAWCFDSMRQHYKMSARWYAAFVRDFMSDGRLVLINGQEGAKYIKLMRDRLSFEYDVIVDESPTSTNMKEKVWAILQPLLPVLGQYGVAPPKEVLDYLPFPSALTEAWKKQMQPDPKAQQMKEQDAQLTLAGKDAENKQKQADATYKTAQAAKIQSEIGQGQPDQTGPALLEARIDSQMEQMKAMLKQQGDAASHDRDAQLKITLEQMRIESNERIEALHASIAMANQPKEQPEEEDEEPAPEPEPVSADPVLETLQQIAQGLSALRKPRKFVYDDRGELAGVE